MPAWDQLDDAALWLAAIVAGIGALGWLTRKGWRAIRWASDLGDTVQKLHRLAEHELTPNSGSSIKDAITRIEAEQKIAKSRLDDHLAQSDEMVRSMRQRIREQDDRHADLVRAVDKLAAALPVVAKSIPPEEG